MRLQVEKLTPLYTQPSKTLNVIPTPTFEVFHTKKGTGDYHEEMNGLHYENWFTEKLLPRLPSGSVIIMNNGPYHSVKEEKRPRMSSLKKDIQDWLRITPCNTTSKLQDVEPPLWEAIGQVTAEK